jgi:Domain of unknown function (DUF4338)
MQQPISGDQLKLLDSPRLMRAHVLRQLAAQGFEIDGLRIRTPLDVSKEALRDLHSSAVRHRIQRAQPSLARHEDRLLKRLASGHELDPQAIRPRLVEITRGSDNELLFRYAALHWSIPVSAGYGRRLRFALVDEAHDNALMGIIGLGDPVYALGVRDRWIGWTAEQRRRSLHRVMDAFVLGAVPPYNGLLVGKFVAMVATSNETRECFNRKYAMRISRITGERRKGTLALVTTSSALGRSSVYNRLRTASGPIAISVGYTAGYGEFHFSDGLYDVITQYAHRYCVPTAKRSEWGTGFRNRREVVKKALQHMGLPADALLRHGVRREVFVMPLGTGCRETLTHGARLQPHSRPLDDMFDTFRDRWLLPRASRYSSWRDWRPEHWRLWDQ